jgi:hypothetical protein
MAITRRVADEAVLRDPAAMRTYLHDMANLFLNAGMEMQIISRVAKRRLSHAQARGQLMSQAEKDAAAKRISRDLHRSALLMSHCSKMIGNAEGILTEVFVPNNRRGGRNNGQNNQQNKQGNQNNGNSRRGRAA